MKKVFNLTVENKNRERQLDSIKNEVRKYIKREKSKLLPEGFDTWRFSCKFALEGEEPQDIEFTNIIKSLDKAYESNKDTFYLEILKQASKRTPKENK